MTGSQVGLTHRDIGAFLILIVTDDHDVGMMMIMMMMMIIIIIGSQLFVVLIVTDDHDDCDDGWRWCLQENLFDRDREVCCTGIWEEVSPIVAGGHIAKHILPTSRYEVTQVKTDSEMAMQRFVWMNTLW